MVDRIALKPYAIHPSRPKENPIHLKARDVVMMPMFTIQRDEKYYPNPEKFDPERFNDVNKDKIINGTYFPFGMGPRVCIGKLAHQPLGM